MKQTTVVLSWCHCVYRCGSSSLFANILEAKQLQHVKFLDGNSRMNLNLPVSTPVLYGCSIGRSGVKTWLIWDHQASWKLKDYSLKMFRKIQDSRGGLKSKGGHLFKKQSGLSISVPSTSMIELILREQRKFLEFTQEHGEIRLILISLVVRVGVSNQGGHCTMPIDLFFIDSRRNLLVKEFSPTTPRED
jgi:hypothetical protein